MSNVLPPPPRGPFNETGWSLMIEWLTKLTNYLNGQTSTGLTGSMGLTAITTTTQLSASANFVTLGNGSGSVQFQTASGPIVISINTYGLGGRDQSFAFANGSTVHFYYVYNSVTNILSGMVSAGGPSIGPTPPTGSGYSYYSYIGSLVLNGASLPIGYLRGSWFYYDSFQTVLTNGVAITPTSLSTAAYVPSTALSVLYDLTVSASNPGTTTYTGSFRPTGQTTMNQYIIADDGTGLSMSLMQNQVDMPPGMGPGIDYQINAAPSAGGISIYVLGYRLPNNAG